MRGTGIAGLCATALLAISLGLVGCDGSDGDRKQASKPSGRDHLVGFAYARGPVSGARIRVYSTDGKMLADAPSATEQRGTFYVEEKHLPVNYRVVATGGTHEGKPFRGELQAEVRGDAGAVIHLSPVSTITSHYMGRKPDASREEAERKVLAHLAIPAALDARDLRVHGRHFDGQVFLAKAARHGGFTAYAKRVAENADGGAAEAFPGRASNQAEIGETIMLGLLSGAAQLGGHSAFGWVLSSIGLGTADTLGPQFAEVNRKLDEVQATLAEIKVKLSDIEREIAEVKYSQIVNTLPLAEIDYVRDQLAFATATKNPTAQKRINEDMTGPGGYIPSKLQDALQKFDRAFTGAGPLQTPLMGAYGDVAKTKSATFPIFTPKDNQLIFGAYDYYDLYLVNALNAIIEWRHARDKRDDQTQTAQSTQDKRKKYRQTLPSRVPDDGVVDTRTKTYWLNQRVFTKYGDARGRIEGLNRDAAHGFKNWQIGRIGELVALVEDRGPQTACAWLSGHGFDKAGLDPCPAPVNAGSSGPFLRPLREQPDDVLSDCEVVLDLKTRGKYCNEEVLTATQAPLLFARGQNLPDERYW